MKKVLLAILPILLLTACDSPEYRIQGDVVVRCHWTFSFGTLYDTLPGADPETFVPVTDWLGHDSERVYFMHYLVPGADVSTLEAKRYPLFCDKNDYYYETKPMHVADMASFKTIKWYSNDFWAKDSRYAYYDSVRIEDADVRSFKVIDHWLARDKNHVYMDGLILPDADPATFKTIKYTAYSRDKSHVWHFDELLVGADPATFEVMKNTKYCRDKSHVWFYFDGTLLVGADPATFEVLGDTDYSRDKSHIWYRGEPIPDADYETFVADYESFAHDKNGYFTCALRDNDSDELDTEEPAVDEPEPE